MRVAYRVPTLKHCTSIQRPQTRCKAPRAVFPLALMRPFEKVIPRTIAFRGTYPQLAKTATMNNLLITRFAGITVVDNAVSRPNWCVSLDYFLFAQVTPHCQLLPFVGVPAASLPLCYNYKKKKFTVYTYSGGEGGSPKSKT